MASNDYLPAILALCQADSTLTSTLTGGIYLQRELDAEIIAPELYPDVFDANGYLKPFLLIRSRSRNSTGGADASIQFHTTRQIIEFWCYNDSGAGYSTLRTAQTRIHQLFDRQRIATGNGRMRWAGVDIETRDPAWLRACLIRRDYALIGSLRGA